MMLTVAWAGSLLIGRCELDDNGESVDGTGQGKISLTKQVLSYTFYSMSAGSLEKVQGDFRGVQGTYTGVQRQTSNILMIQSFLDKSLFYGML